jgi:hypothetical protein
MSPMLVLIVAMNFAVHDSPDKLFDILNHFEIEWHTHLHFTILMSKEQSRTVPVGSDMGHSPGHSTCRPRLQKKVESTLHRDTYQDNLRFFNYKLGVLLSEIYVK